MIPDRLILTPEGEQALMNADAGGVMIRPKSFKVGDYSGVEPLNVPSDLLGTLIFNGRLHYIEVQSKKTVVFTVQVPAQAGMPTKNITEAVVLLDDGTTLGRVRFSTPLVKYAKEAVTISFMLHLSQSNSQTIDVTLSEFGSVPSVMSVDSLPAAVTSIVNAVAVLDLAKSSSGNYCPGLAIKNSNGGAHWGFIAHDEIFNDRLETGAIDSNTISLPHVVSEFGLGDGDEVILSVHSGPGAGETRRFYVAANGNLLAKNTGFTSLSGSSALSIWIPVASRVTGSNGLPNRDGIDPAWVLAAGSESSGPRWVPPSGSSSKTRGNLYHPPGKLIMQTTNIIPAESGRVFDLYSEDPSQTGANESQIHLYSYRKNNNYAMINLSGVYQNRQSFEISNNVIEFPEDVSNDLVIDARLYELQPHTGVYTTVERHTYQGDGTTRRFPCSSVESIHYTLISMGRVKLATGSYSYDPATSELVFTEAPAAGVKFEINCFVQNPLEGYSTHVSTVSVRIGVSTNVIILPFSPQDVEQVFVHEQGLGLYKDEYAIVGNKIVSSVNFNIGSTVEVMIFDNVIAQGSRDTGLTGMVVDAVTTSKGIELIRQGMPAIRVPMPEIELEGADGVIVEGQFPSFKIRGQGSQSSAARVTSISVGNLVENTNEITVTHRLEFTSDITLMITADFDAVVGPGFTSAGNNEAIQFALSIIPPGGKAIEYGRNQAGSGEVGLTSPSEGASGALATAVASRTICTNIIAENTKAKYVEIQAKMRVVRTDVTSFGSILRAAISGVAIPRV